MEALLAADSIGLWLEVYVQKKAIVFCSEARFGHSRRWTKIVTVEITPPKMTLVYHQVEGPAAPASYLLLPPLLLENMGAAIYAPSSLALNCCFVGGLGYSHTCVLDTFPMWLWSCVQRSVHVGMSMPRGTEGGHR